MTKLHDTTVYHLCNLCSPSLIPVDNMPTYTSSTKFFLWAYAIWGSYLKTEEIIDKIEEIIYKIEANGNNPQLPTGHDVTTLRWRSYEIR